MENAGGSPEGWIVPSQTDEANINPINTAPSESSNPDNHALLAELSTLNKQIAAFAWRLLDSDLTTEEQLSLVNRMESVGKIIRERIGDSPTEQHAPRADEQ